MARPSAWAAVFAYEMTQISTTIEIADFHRGDNPDHPDIMGRH
jgi:hypothetical protein